MQLGLGHDYSTLFCFSPGKTSLGRLPSENPRVITVPLYVQVA
jgi:hypothetical protein